MKRFFSLLLVIVFLCSTTQITQAAFLAAPSTVSGVVADSGHGYPMYARITISGGTSQVLYTNPFTGAYSVNLTQGLTYTFDVEALGIPGYEVKSDVFIPNSASYTRNISLRISDPAACTAPGYARIPIVNIDFETSNGGFSPSGQNYSWAHGVPTSGPWSAHSGTRVWATNLGGNYSNDEYSNIESSIFDLSGRRGIEIRWAQWLQTYDNFDYSVVEASNNGGAGWAIKYGNEYSWGTTTKGDMSGNYDLAWTERAFILDSSWAVNNFKVRFRFKSDWNLIGTAAPGWYIDDLQIITCEPVAGGLVGGFVTDANSGAPLVDATVSYLGGHTATSIATPGDPAVEDGLYFVFVPGSGGKSVIASKTYYATTSFGVSVTPNAFNRLDIPLHPNYDVHVVTDPVDKSGYPNQTITFNLSLTNTGFLPGELLINQVTLPPGPLWPTSLSIHKTALVAGGASVPATVTVSIPPFTPTGTVSTVILRAHWIGILHWVIPPASHQIILTSTALNAPPETQEQSLITPEEVPVDMTLFALDPNGDALNYEHTQPAHGSLSGALPYLTYTPQTDYFGPDEFTFTASDGTLTSTTTLVTITVTNVNDVPIASDQSVTIDEDNAKNITLAATDIENDLLTWTVGTATHGILTGLAPNLTYTPDLNYNGPDSFTFMVNDGAADSNIATVTINVNAINDAPTASVIEDVNWLARVAHVYAIPPFSDVDGDILTYSATVEGGALPAWLVIDPNTGQFSGTPTNQNVGVYELEVTADDGHGGTISTVFELTVAINPFLTFLPILSR